MNAKFYFTPRRRQQVHGFTLIELLVAITIIAILAALAFAGTQAALQQARKSREVGAAKTLIAAYQAYPADHNGALMAGNDQSIGQIQLPSGDAVYGPTVARYPYRLAAYFDYQMQGSILVNRNATQFDTRNTYLVSLYPALGINHDFVGGSIGSDGAVNSSGDCLTFTGQSSSSPLVFASASNGTAGDGAVDGYCFLTPPNLTSKNWKTAEWEKDSSSEDYGHVDARYGGKAVCAFLDGAVRMHSIDELRDMRLWSAGAYSADDSDYKIQKKNGGGRL